ncbi:ABC transporter ATP-binding protein [Ornithinimicrobium cryptoxanthini]|uniref:ABC transporter ATP-binding protein n=1 Tax=Ornithinimicrobium cryptoxanthini TaxID=2934161 RepID=A0ABY4YFE4_9MICO|nr:ABC transporter ATP-binding protein [Ornithinimicrobium cryptoxanthini]USQ74877.1 ABC transporter ATP-binding protein [Ornithinimicrobium cryptoxanthini]
MGSPVIEVVHLAKSYGSTRAVADVSLTVAEGEIFGILGPNGAGKTTTVECLSGLRSPDSGSVRVLGIDPLRDPAAVRQVLGVQLQESRLPGKLRVLEALRLYAAFYPEPADPEELLGLLGLTDRRDTSYRDLSGGQKQRLSIALALVGRPRVAILDELTTGLDPQARRETWGLIERVRDSGVTVLLVTHFMDEAERLCDRLVVIDRGQVVAQGSPAELTGDDGEQRTFRMRLPAGSLPGTGLLTALPEVTVAHEVDDLLEVTGTATVLPAVIIALHDRGIVPDEVRTVSRSLEDAFVALVARNPQEETQR